SGAPVGGAASADDGDGDPALPGGDKSASADDGSAGLSQGAFGAPTLTPASQAALQAQAAAPRATPQTVASLAAQMVKKLEGRSTRFDVELEPAGLGKVNVSVEIGAHGRVTAALACDNPQAVKELQARSGELQQALQQAGFDLSDGLSFNLAGGGGQQPGAGQQQQDSSGQAAFRGRAFQTALGAADDVQTAAGGLAYLRNATDSGLDIRI
ncbi:MAG: flagellar hook-length control protein FliK, partial [Alphaproteobacteria bacterium]|nr:flagellar hook-length control protein FliK [Alphaproteobacteria bacterium]